MAPGRHAGRLHEAPRPAGGRTQQLGSEWRGWMAGWLGGPVIGIANGAVREAGYAGRVGELRAHQISTATGIALFAGYFTWLDRRRPASSTPTALKIGGVWVGLTVAFEFELGHYVGGKPFRELLRQYDVRQGYVWPFLLGWIGLGPAAVSALRRRRAAQRR